MNKLSLQLKLQLLLGFVGLAGMTALFVIANDGSSSTLDAERRQVESATASTADKIDRNLFERYGDVQAFALSEPARAMSVARIEAFMNDMMGAYAPIYDAMMVLDKNGNVIAVNGVDKAGKSPSGKSLIGKNYASEAWFKEAASGSVKAGTAYFTDLYVDDDTAQFIGSDGRVMTFSAPIRDPKTGQILGVWANRMSWKDVVVSIVAGESLKLLSEAGTKVQPIVVNADGVYLIHSDEKRVLADKQQVFKPAKYDPKKPWSRMIELDGTSDQAIEAFANSLGYSSFPGRGWVYQFDVTPSTQLRATVFQHMILFAIIMLVLNVIGYFVIRGISKRISQVIDHLHNESSRLSNTSTDVTQASASLAGSSTEQAASLQETAASIEEINAMIKKSSENATHSQQVAQRSQDIANKGKQAVDEMSRAIADINVSNEYILGQISESNRKISEIARVIAEIGNKTKVINDIVFQTKLLSFNASVEAARAGEHGKGFAVVAEEVGNLAQMSGNAAKEISEMLSDSIKRVDAIVEETKSKVEGLISQGRTKIEAGTVIAKQCGDVLVEVVDNVAELNSMVSEISVASREQSQGVNEITKAINELDKTTHMNATTSMEVSGFAEQLRSQATDLNGVVSELLSVVRGDGSAVDSMSTQSFDEGQATKKDRAKHSHGKSSAMKARRVTKEQGGKKTAVNGSATGFSSKVVELSARVGSSSVEVPDADDARFKEI